MSVPLLVPESRWECPNCTLTDVTRNPEPHTRMHACAALQGLTAPMVPAGTRCKVEAREWEDYVGTEMVHTDGTGRPFNSVEVTRDDGNDLAVLAPCATLDMRAG